MLWAPSSSRSRRAQVEGQGGVKEKPEGAEQLFADRDDSDSGSRASMEPGWCLRVVTADPGILNHCESGRCNATAVESVPGRSHRQQWLLLSVVELVA